MNPTCSLLLPSRGRVEKLLRTIRTSRELADDPASVQYLVKLDDDDAASLNRAQDLRELGAIVVVTPRLRGYRDLHRYYNVLACLADGDWLWMFNDDAEVTSQAWDANLRTFASQCRNRPFCVFPWIDAAAHFSDEWKKRYYSIEWRCDFPIINRPLYDIVGHHSMSGAADVYWIDLTRKWPEARINSRLITVCHSYDRDETHPHNTTDVEANLTQHSGAEVQRSLAIDLRKLGLFLSSGTQGTP